jgi:Rieske Fe-S protein
MATTRRIFLEIFGTGAAVSALELGCGSVITGGPAVIGGPDEPNPEADAGSTDDDASDALPAQGNNGMLQPGDVLAGNVSNLAVGAIVVVPGQTVAMARDAGGVYALTLICTHQGCPVAPFVLTSSSGLICPCHGSRYDRNGAVVRGPANLPLVHFAVEIDAAGDIVVHTARQVAATTRAPVS